MKLNEEESRMVWKALIQARYRAFVEQETTQALGDLKETIDAAYENGTGVLTAMSKLERPALPLLPIVVGGRYRRRDGVEVTIDEDDGTKTPFRSSEGEWYMADGKYASSDPEDRRFDLIERIA